MFEIFTYTFFQYALWAILLLSLASGVVGTYVVSRRLVFIAGGITHASFGGLGLGFFLGINSTLMAALFAVASALGVDHLSRHRVVREDSAIALFWALGMALGIIFLFLTPGYTPGLTTFLFGNILTLGRDELLLFAAFVGLVILFFFYFWRPILLISFDREFAESRKLPVLLVEKFMMVVVALCVVFMLRLVGVMLLMSLLTIPQMVVSLFTHRYLQMVWGSALVSLLAGLLGLFVSYWLNVPTGATIVCSLTLFYLSARLLKRYLLRRASRSFRG